jgi:hypothetical protein
MDNRIYFGSWNGQEDMWLDFQHNRYSDEAKEPFPEGIEVLFAFYGSYSYEGAAFVLFRKDGTLYEVNGSHCSCYGLEGMWEPEETTVASLTQTTPWVFEHADDTGEAKIRFFQLLKELG